MTQRVNLFVAFCFSTAMVCSVGCGGSSVADKSDATTSTNDSQKTAAISTETNSVPPTKSTSSTSPATLTSAAPKGDATAEEVCHRFMNLIRSGNRIAAENLLTKTALRITTQAGLQLEPMGGPTAVYEVCDVRYATTKQKLAQVECSITDKVDGEDYEMNVTWLVRKQNTGWRISGVMLELDSGQIPDLLSFENIDDVSKIKGLAEEDVIESSDVSRQADASSPNIK